MGDDSLTLKPKSHFETLQNPWANGMNSVAVLAAAYLAAGTETQFHGIRQLIGAQVDLLPGLAVYTALTGDIIALSLLAVCGGLWFDSLSANPLGVSILPIFLVGWVVYLYRHLVLRDELFAQFILGMAASAASPLLTLFILFNLGRYPLVNWTSLWQWTVMAIGGGVVTPFWFILFGRIHRGFDYPAVNASSFREDREIKRGRD